MNSPWLKAGLIGAGVLLVLSLLSLVPLVSCIAPILQLLAFIGIGALVTLLGCLFATFVIGALIWVGIQALGWIV